MSQEDRAFLERHQSRRISQVGVPGILAQWTLVKECQPVANRLPKTLVRRIRRERILGTRNRSFDLILLARWKSVSTRRPRDCVLLHASIAVARVQLREHIVSPLHASTMHDRAATPRVRDVLIDGTISVGPRGRPKQLELIQFHRVISSRGTHESAGLYGPRSGRSS